VDGAVEKVLMSSMAVCCELGAAIVQVTAPDIKQSVLDWPAACAVEAAVAHEDTYPPRKNEYGPALAALLDAARIIPATDFQKLSNGAQNYAVASRCSFAKSTRS
jgi:amidase